MVRLPVSPGIHVLDPLGYLGFRSLEASAAAVVTDSGGVQEETTYLGVPCFTLRENTERPVTIRRGTNVLLGLDPRRIADVPSLLARAVTPPQAPEGWDGSAAARLADVVVGALVGESSAAEKDEDLLLVSSAGR